MQEPLDAQSLLIETVRFWRAWAGASRYHGRWREMVTRSALVLKMLTFLPTGRHCGRPYHQPSRTVGRSAQLGLPVYLGPRCSLFRLRSHAAGLYRGGCRIRRASCRLALKRRKGKRVRLTSCTASTDATTFREDTLDHLDGYMGSKPVRIGNAAVGHLQLDIYGELMDSIYLYDKYGSPLSYDMWLTVERLLDWVAENWQQEDQSIWEVRGGRRDFTYSKLQCWVALDRGIRLARKALLSDRRRHVAAGTQSHLQRHHAGWLERTRARFYPILRLCCHGRQYA